MKSENKAIRVCPICGAEYSQVPAISRIDNSTPICPECGTRQALDSLGIKKEEQEEIISIIRKTYAQYRS